ncbi:cytochrome c [Mucilaginibacter sp.]|uniref:c-type cytochrome n=1 Tax=Mucilaginibacter sp. TaxID=1882438 RepID=UPI0028405F28|nr:cytochrome c [Mucilaginibacter sp.]MDR3693654.1 cytochrome c [Mucilaginibacter sp.]
MKIKLLAIILVSTLLFNGLQAQVTHKKKTVHHSGTAVSMARGKVVYGKICVACHMADGNGVPMMNPPLINTTYVLGDKTKLITIVLNGFKEEVEINGQTYSNIMTPHKDLTDQQIADVLTFVRRSFGNKASSVKTSEVKKVRATIK